MGDLFKKYELGDKKRQQILDMLAIREHTQNELADIMGENPSTIGFYVNNLMNEGYITRVKKFHAPANKLRFVFIPTGVKFIPRSKEQIQEEINIRMKRLSDLAHGKVPEHKLKPTSPHGRIVRNLDRPGSDYAWQRPKRKHTTVGIGSSFSLYDGLT